MHGDVCRAVHSSHCQQKQRASVHPYGQDGATLNKQTRLLTAEGRSVQLQGVLVDIHRLVCLAMAPRPEISTLVATQPVAPPHRQRRRLRIGFGGAGRLGCADARGQAVRWKPLLDTELGVPAAFANVGLDVLGLHAARVQEGTSLAPDSNFLLEARWSTGYEGMRARG